MPIDTLYQHAQSAYEKILYKMKKIFLGRKATVKIRNQYNAFDLRKQMQRSF